MKILICTLALLFSSIATASPMEREIKHLLKFVGSTQCQYERNGERHSGEEAVEHIKKKYAYYKDDISSTADFINYSASKSKMSGRAYLIHCPGQQVMTSSDWLNMELKRYRAVMASRDFVKRG